MNEDKRFHDPTFPKRAAAVCLPLACGPLGQSYRNQTYAMPESKKHQQLTKTTIRIACFIPFHPRSVRNECNTNLVSLYPVMFSTTVLNWSLWSVDLKVLRSRLDMIGPFQSARLSQTGYMDMNWENIVQCRLN